MVRASWQLAAATLVSLCGVCLTNIWYYRAARAFNGGSAGTKPMAFVMSGAQDVERKPDKRLVWESAKEGETLFTRDTIRTEGRATRIRMIDSGAVIELAPNSVIVMAKSDDKVSLDLVNGGMTLKSAGAKGKAQKSHLVVEVGGTKLATSGHALEMSISKDANGKAAVAVTRGTVAGVAAGRAFAVDQGKSGTLDGKGLSTDSVIQVLGPGPGSTVDIGRGDQPVAVRWRPLKKEYQVQAELSDDGSTWRRAPGGASAGDSGSLSMPVPAGLHTWRLVAVNASGATTMTSIAFSITAVELRPPELETPPDGAPILQIAGKGAVTFRWIGAASFDSYLLRIGKDRAFTSVVAQKSQADSSGTTIDLREPGTYFWQVVASTKNGAKTIGSDVRSFTVARHAVSVNLVAPANNQRIPASVAAAGVLIKWRSDPVQDAVLLAVDRQGGEAAARPLRLKVSGSEHLLNGLEPGTYTWSIQATDGGPSDSTASNGRTFVVVPMAKLGWLAPEGDLADTKVEVDRQPTVVKLAWERGPDGAAAWRINVADNPTLQGATAHDVRAPAASLSLATAGSYFMKAQALNRDGHVLGETPARRIELVPPPKLQPPRMLHLREGSMVATPAGESHAEWAAVQGAKAYKATLLDADGHVVLEKTVTATSLDLHDLLPGTYSLSLSSINRADQPGNTLPPILVTVPQLSSIAAPAIHDLDIK